MVAVVGAVMILEIYEAVVVEMIVVTGDGAGEVGVAVGTVGETIMFVPTAPCKS